MQPDKHGILNPPVHICPVPASRLRETQGETMNKSSDIAKLCNEIQEIMEVIIKAQFQKYPRNQRIISMVKLSSVTKR